MQSRHIRALIVVSALSSLGSLGTALYLLISPTADFVAHAANPKNNRSSVIAETKPSSALGFQELQKTQSRPLFRIHRVPFVPQLQAIAATPPPAPPQTAPPPPTLPPSILLAAAPAPQAASAPVVQAEVPQFVLKGVLIRQPDKKALLTSSEKPQGQWYAVGEAAWGWTLDAIQADKITLKKSDQTTDLFLYVDNQNKPVGTP